MWRVVGDGGVNWSFVGCFLMFGILLFVCDEVGFWFLFVFVCCLLMLFKFKGY